MVVRLTRLRFLVLLLALAGGAHAGEATLEERLARVDREAVGRLLRLAASADRAKDVALARRLYGRMLELDPDQQAARRELGFKKGPKGWTRDKPLPEVGPLVEADGLTRREQLEQELAALEAARGAEVVALCAAATEREAARRHLEALLRRLPRHAGAHAALGHEQVGDRWARPALLGLARRTAATLGAWGACRDGLPEALPSGERLVVPGIEEHEFQRVGTRLVVAAYADPLGTQRARETEAAQRLLALLLGQEAKRHDPERVVLLEAKDYEAFVRSRHAEEQEVLRRLRASNYVAPGLLALRAVAASASDMYAHNVGFVSAQSLGSPRVPEDPERRNLDAYAWWKEGLGYLLSLELWDSALTSFFSNAESNRKVKDTLPPPTVRNRATLLDWVRALVLREEAYGLREVVGRSLNSLDFQASIQAWTFVRFLALEDPGAFLRLPAALRAQEHGSEPERVEAALLATYGRDLATLETLWRLWLLELC